MKNVQNDKPKKSVGKKIFLFGLVSLAAGLVSYFGFQFWKKNKEENGDAKNAPDPVKQSKSAPNPNPGKQKTKPGNSQSNPKPGTGKAAPNGSGSPQAASSINAIQIAGDIHAAILKKDFTAAFNQLKLIKSVNDYSAVSKIFLKTRAAG
ncbi:MAG TPA: hypothetical protein PLE32_22875, partial [Haliscomenobacter sp.]|nr:hypothetical protein [Haliscomenobacter sp.]